MLVVEHDTYLEAVVPLVSALLAAAACALSRFKMYLIASAILDPWSHINFFFRRKLT